MAEYKPVKDYPIEKYKCGLKAGDKVRLLRDILIKDHNDKPTGKIYRKGEVWTVLPSSKEPPVVVWFRQADGEPHTWDDDQSIYHTFQRISE